MTRKVTKKRRLFKLIFLALVMATVSALCFAQFGGGQGTAEDPWQISRAEHLSNIRDYMGPEHFDKHWVLTADIDLGIVPWNQGEGWEPMGTGWVNDGFTGYLDGNGHVIDNLFINRPNSDHNALFAYTGRGVTAVPEGHTITIKNLKFRNVDITGGGRTAAIAGWHRGHTQIINCVVTGTIEGTSRVGGIVGFSQNPNTYIINCYSRADVTGQSETGGLLGANTNNHIVRNSYSTGRVNGPDGTVGGITGACAGEIENSYWDVQTSGREWSAGEAQGRQTEQMVHPYDDETYIDWDFDDIWVHDPDRANNNGYPYLFHQDYEPPIIIDPPTVEVALTVIDEVDHVQLSWNPVEDANSYKIYASGNPDAEDWGDPVAIIEQTQFADPVLDENRVMFYYVTASAEDAP